MTIHKAGMDVDFSQNRRLRLSVTVGKSVSSNGKVLGRKNST
jgi:hypothetical protein